MMRIFVGPTEIAGIGDGLRRGFADLGHQCDLVTAVQHPFSYGDEGGGSQLTNAWQSINKKIANLKIPRSRKLHLYLMRFLLNWMVFIDSLIKYDGYIFLYGMTLTNTKIELSVLKFLRKKIIFCYVGSDARPPYMDGGKFQPPFEKEDIQRVFKETKRVANLLALHEKYADQIVSSPTIAQFNKRPLVNWFEIGIPRAIEFEPANASIVVPGNKIRVLHSPSNPRVKGTAIIEQAVASLNSKGLDIDLIMLEGMPNRLVLEEIAKADFVVDQVFSDQPLATFAAEAAHFGKPAVVSGYFSEVISKYLKPELVGPSEFVSPDELELAIEKLVTDAPYRSELGRKAKQYVDRRWSPRAVAERYLRLLEGDVPDEWYFDPFETMYVEGCGLPKQAIADLVGSVADFHNDSALAVDDKPRLKEALLALVAHHNESTEPADPQKYEPY